MLIKPLVCGALLGAMSLFYAARCQSNPALDLIHHEKGHQMQLEVVPAYSCQEWLELEDSIGELGVFLIGLNSRCETSACREVTSNLLDLLDRAYAVAQDQRERLCTEI